MWTFEQSDRDRTGGTRCRSLTAPGEAETIRRLWAVWALCLSVGVSACDDEEQFTGEVSCNKNPQLTVTLGRGECALLPRCTGGEDHRPFPRSNWSWGGERSFTDGAINKGARDLPGFESIAKLPDVEVATSPGGNLQLCAGNSALPGSVHQGWIGVDWGLLPDDDTESEKGPYVVSFRIAVSGLETDAGIDDAGLPPPDAGTPPPDGGTPPPDAGVGVDASTPDTGPAPGIADAFLSPKLPPGVETHFTGVTQFVMAKLTNRAAELRVSCSLSGGDDCDMTFDVSAPSGDSTMSEVALLPSMAEGQYEFSLRADQSGTLSDEVLLTAELRPSVGMLKCEQATNGFFGADEERWFGLQLETPGGSPVATADYYMYERTTPGQGWGSPTGQFTGQSELLHFGRNDYINPDRNFLIIAVDSMSGTVVAAREFRWDELEGGPTQACSVCDKSLNGDCTIIPLE